MDDYIEVTEEMFVKEFTGKYKDKFSREGLKVIFDYYEACIRNDNAPPIELDFDPECVCQYFVEYANIKEFQDDYSMNYKDMYDVDMDFKTMLIKGTERFLIHN